MPLDALAIRRRIPHASGLKAVRRLRIDRAKQEEQPSPTAAGLPFRFGANPLSGADGSRMAPLGSDGCAELDVRENC